MFHLMGEGGRPLGLVKSQAVAEELVKQGKAIYYSEAKMCRIPLWPDHAPKRGEYVESAEFMDTLCDVYKNGPSALIVGPDGPLGTIIML